MELFGWSVYYGGLLLILEPPLESKKKGYHVSGFPGLAFFHFLVAGLLSPYKWLAVTALLDISVTYLPIFLIKEHFSSNKENKGNE